MRKIDRVEMEMRNELFAAGVDPMEIEELVYAILGTGKRTTEIRIKRANDNRALHAKQMEIEEFIDMLLERDMTERNHKMLKNIYTNWGALARGDIYRIKTWDIAQYFKLEWI